MNEEQLCDPETLASFDRAFGELLDLIPRGKKPAAFQPANYCEVVAKSALRALRKAAEARKAAQTG